MDRFRAPACYLSQPRRTPQSRRSPKRAMSRTFSAAIVMTEAGAVHAPKTCLPYSTGLTNSRTQSSYVASVTTRTTETVSAQPAAGTTNQSQTAETARTWKARDIQRLGQLPLDTDDPSPAQTEARITALNNRVRDLPGDEDVGVSEEEDGILKEILRCEGQG